MAQNKKAPAGGLLLAGLAAYAYYKYSKMTSEEKENLVGDLKAKGQKLYDEYMPEQVKTMFAKGYTPSTPSNATPKYGEGSDYAN
ncbi:MAG TPA: hypothetical protein VF623_02680 [Segetibacter sp.]